MIKVDVERVVVHANGAERIDRYTTDVDATSPLGMMLQGSTYRVVTYQTTGTSTIYERTTA